MTTESVRLLDVNVLLALHDPVHVHHHPARRWHAKVSTWATTPVTEVAFLRLTANPLVRAEIVPLSRAREYLHEIRDAPGHRFLPDGSSLDAPRIDLSRLQGHRQVTDFHLVNLAARHGAVLATFDTRLVASLAPADRQHVELIPV